MADAWFGRVDRPFRFASPFAGHPFALLLVIGDEDVTPEEQWDLSQAIRQQGCVYACCWGHDSGAWDESIDMAGVMEALDGASPPDVMTTWHEDPTLDPAVDFFADDTRIDDARPERFAVLLVGGSREFETCVRDAVRRRFAIAPR